MTVALDVGPVRAEPAGVGVYAAQLALAAADEDDIRISLIGVRPDARALDRLARQVVSLPLQVSWTTGGRWADSYHAWLHLQANADARRTGAALAHFTNACAPLRTTVPFVVTVHDLSVLRFPHLHPTPRLAIVPFMLNAIARARAVIVPSRAIGRELKRTLRVSRQRLVTIEHAPSQVVETDAASDRVLARLGLVAGEYLISVGTLEPRKNIARLVAAFERVAGLRPNLKLVLVGAAGWRRAGIERRMALSPFRQSIVVAGYLPAAEVTSLVRSAAAFCYVSVYEGYGLPVIEALAAGAAVVTSNRSGMVEAAGGAAVLVDPFSEASIAAGIVEALGRTDELIAAGRERAARRAWADVAAEHAEVYRWAVARRP